MLSLGEGLQVTLIGVGATAVMDAWLALLSCLGVKSTGLAPIGRWVGHLMRGTLAHEHIARAAPIRGELALGWVAHYATGIAFAALLVAIAGMAWTQRPTPLPALLVGAATVVAPLLVMQPAMGAGFASSRTPTPVRNCLRALANHVVFGLGLYLTAALAAWLLD